MEAKRGDCIEGGASKTMYILLNEYSLDDGSMGSLELNITSLFMEKIHSIKPIKISELLRISNGRGFYIQHSYWFKFDSRHNERSLNIE